MPGIKDIARELGLSVSTVSLALRDDPKVAENTKRRVLEKAKELDFFPNSIARSLKAGRSKLILMIVMDAALMYVQNLIREVECVTASLGYNFLLATTYGENGEMAKRYVTQHWGDGLIICTGTLPKECLVQNATERYPIYTIGNSIQEGHVRSFLEPGPEKGVLSVEYLWGQGFRRIAFVKGPGSSLVVQEKYRGYLRGLEKVGLSFDESLVFCAESYDIEAGRRITESIGRRFQEQRDIDAVIYSGDEIAIGGLQTLWTMGIRVPEDLSVLSQTYSMGAAAVIPPLTTEEIRFVTDGKAQVEALVAGMIEQIEGRDPRPYLVKVQRRQEYQIVERSSVLTAEMRKKIDLS